MLLRGKTSDEIEWSDIEQLVLDRTTESETLEFKGAFNDKGTMLLVKGDSDFRNKIRKALCAFSNAGGGTFIVGITEDKDKKHVAGSIQPFDDPVERAEELQRSLFDQLRPSPPMKVRAVQRADGKGVVLASVAESNRKPVSMGEYEAFVRRGTETRRMSIDEIKSATLLQDRRLANLEKSLDRNVQTLRNETLWGANSHTLLVCVTSHEAVDFGPLDTPCSQFSDNTETEFLDAGSRGYLRAYVDGRNWRPVLGGLKSISGSREEMAQAVRTRLRRGVCLTIAQDQEQDRDFAGRPNSRAVLRLRAIAAEVCFALRSYLRLAQGADIALPSGVLQVALNADVPVAFSDGLSQPIAATSAKLGLVEFDRREFEGTGGALACIRELQRDFYNLAGLRFEPSAMWTLTEDQLMA